MLGQVCYLQLTAGTRLVMQPLAGFFFASMGECLGTSVDILEYFPWIVGSWEPETFKSKFFLGDGNGSEKLGRNGFLYYSATYLIEILSGSIGPNVPLLPEGIK